MAHEHSKFKTGDRVRKTKGSSWVGKVVGFYRTGLTEQGYAVESETEKGSVQIYPEAALELYPYPFTPKEVTNLNRYQAEGRFHPFTCGGDRCGESHDHEGGTLVATVRGWICPYCDYTQDWAHDFMKQYAGLIVDAIETQDKEDGINRSEGQ